MNTTVKKFGGRKKGTPNKTPDEIRQKVQNFISENIESIQSDFEQLEPQKRLEFLEKLLKHVLPRPLNELEKLTEDQLSELNRTIKAITFDKD